MEENPTASGGKRSSKQKETPTAAWPLEVLSTAHRGIVRCLGGCPSRAVSWPASALAGSAGLGRLLLDRSHDRDHAVGHTSGAGILPIVVTGAWRAVPLADEDLCFGGELILEKGGYPLEIVLDEGEGREDLRDGDTSRPAAPG